MARIKSTDRNDEDDVQITRVIPSSPILKTADEIFPPSQFIAMKNNNSRLPLSTYQCDHPILIAILRHHSMRVLFSAHPLVPKFYLQQFWSTLKFQQGDPMSDESQEDCFVGMLDSSLLELTLPMLRNALNLPSRTSYVPFPSNHALLEDIQKLGYDGVLTSFRTFDFDLISSLWCTMLQLICNCLTYKASGKDYATKRSFLFLTGFAFNKQYDYAQLIWEEIHEVLKKKAKTAYVPFQRFLQMVIHFAMTNDEDNVLPDRSSEPTYDVYDVKRFYHRKNGTKISGMPIPNDVLSCARGTDLRVIAYRKSLAPMIQSSPAESSQGAIEPNPSEGPAILEGKHKDKAATSSSDSSEFRGLSDSSNDSDDNDDGGDGDKGMRVQTPVHTPTKQKVVSPTGISEGGVEKIVSEGESKQQGIKKIKTPPSPKIRRRGTKSSTPSRPSTKSGKKVVDSPPTQIAQTTLRHSRSPLRRVSHTTGTKPRSLTSTRLGNEVIEEEDQQPRSSPSFDHLVSLEPPRSHVESSIGLRDDSGTVVGRSPSDRIQGSTGNPSTVNITPAVNEGPSGGYSVEPLDKPTGNLSDPGLPKWFKPPPKPPVEGRGKTKIDYEQELNEHLDNIAVARTMEADFTIRPSPPSSESIEVVCSTPPTEVISPILVGQHAKTPSKTPSTPSQFSSLKDQLKTLPRSTVEEVLLDHIRAEKFRSLRDCAIYDALYIDQDFAPQSFEEIFEAQSAEIEKVLAKYAAFARACRPQAGQSLKRDHPDGDSDDSHPAEGEDRNTSVEGEVSKRQKQHSQEKQESSEKESKKNEGKGERKLEELSKRRRYDDESLKDTKRAKYTQLMHDDLVEELKERMFRKTVQHAAEPNPNPRSQKFDTPELINLSKPDGWHKRINTPFVEDQVIKFYRKKVKEVDEALLLGLTKKDKKVWHTFKCLFRYKNLGKTVYSNFGILTVKKVGVAYFRGLKYPTFSVIRMDKKAYEFSEADFPNLNPKDIDWLYNAMKLWVIKNKTDKFAEDCIKLFMEGQVKRAILFDFQIALESGQKRMNATPPIRFFSVEDYPLWKIVNFEENGIVYTSPFWEEKLVMLFNEVSKYSTGTLINVLKEIEGILERGDEDLLRTGKWSFTKKDYEEGKEEIVKCLDYRRKIQKYEVCLKIRENRFSKYAMLKAHERFEIEKEREECKKLYSRYDQVESSSQAPQQE